MSDKTHPAGSQRETAALTAGESKGAVVITGNGMPAGYEPPSGALTAVAPAAPAASSGDTGGGAGSAAAAPAGDGE